MTNFRPIPLRRWQWPKDHGWLVCAALVTVGFAVWVYLLAIECVAIGGVWQSRWAHFLAGSPNSMGDALAGFIGSLTLIWVVASVFQQSKELKQQREEFHRTNDLLAAQQFESAFFNLLTNLDRVVGSTGSEISTPGTSKSASMGEAFFPHAYANLRWRYEELDQPVGREQLVLSVQAWVDMFNVLLGRYVMTVASNLRFLTTNERAKPHHLELFKANLSDAGLIVLFYYCLSEKARDLKSLSEKTALFEHIQLDALLELAHKDLFQTGSFQPVKAL